jgi:hypothetical protein
VAVPGANLGRTPRIELYRQEFRFSLASERFDPSKGTTFGSGFYREPGILLFFD